MSYKLEPAIWSRGTGQRIACFDRCQLIIAGISNIKEVHGKLRLYVSFLEYGRHVGQLRRRRRRRRAYAPTSNTASQDNHEKINSWVSFIFPLHDEYGLRVAALRAAGAPLKRSEMYDGTKLITSVLASAEEGGGVREINYIYVIPCPTGPR